MLSYDKGRSMIPLLFLSLRHSLLPWNLPYHLPPPFKNNKSHHHRHNNEWYTKSPTTTKRLSNLLFSNRVRKKDNLEIRVSSRTLLQQSTSRSH